MEKFSDEEIEEMLQNPLDIIDYTDTTETELQKIHTFLDQNSEKPRVSLKSMIGKEIRVLGAVLRVANGEFILYTPECRIHISQWNTRTLTVNSIPTDQEDSIYCNRSGAGRYLYIFHEPLKMRVKLSKTMKLFKKYDFEVLNE